MGNWSFREALAYLDSLAQFGWKLDLARIRRLCELAGHPQRRFRSLLVGGSAGKGSTCAFLASIIQAAGYRVGSSPKPHLISHRERVQVNGVPISEADFARHMAALVPLAEQVTREEGSPTVFEVMTLLAFMHFAAQLVEWAVVEVGLGGRFDATNVLEPEVSIITMIGLDHTDRLGGTLEEIAFEKAGIIRPRGRVITGAVPPALGVIEQVARERGSGIARLGGEITLSAIRTQPEGTALNLRTPWFDWHDLHLRMAGEHQAGNAALAVAAAGWLAHDGVIRLDEAAVRAGLERAAIPGRLQVVRRNPLVVLDGAHSPDRADALARAIRTLYLHPHPERRLILVIGCSQGHSPEVVVQRLAPFAAQVIATRSRHPAAVPAAEVTQSARDLRVPAFESEPVSAAVAEALRHAGPDDLIVVTGSLFAVGEALEALQP